ncbi:c-type heme family protein [Mongoliitalea daihaiensis]|uniref:c-type heme family protein n=1 Tax=Mongoliitalea daihaiensis TaxID=2782006 RepID=UPI001F40A07A|nr:DUF3365 domain-containing protein [Mongoliitalea daihaiensis]
MYLISILSACGTNERVSREVFEEVNRSMEAKKLSESQIIEVGMKWGEEISTEAQQQLISALQKAIQEKGVAGAVDFCHVQALPILKEVDTKHGVQIKRASVNYRNPLDKPDDTEAVILDAYQYNVEEGIMSEPNIQKVEGGEVFLYTKAILIPNALCLNCHGSPGTDIAPETWKVLQEKYPNDQAINHKVGDLRGMWSIRIPKKEVVKRM